MAGAASRLVGGRLRGLRVLIAEDAYVLADTLAVMLEQEGASVQGPFGTAADAIASLHREQADLALVDLRLRDAFADRLIEELVRLEVPYAIVTGFGSLPTNADAHAIAVLQKPIDIEALINLLSRLAGPA